MKRVLNGALPLVLVLLAISIVAGQSVTEIPADLRTAAKQTFGENKSYFIWSPTKSADPWEPGFGTFLRYDLHYAAKPSSALQPYVVIEEISAGSPTPLTCVGETAYPHEPASIGIEKAMASFCINKIIKGSGRITVYLAAREVSMVNGKEKVIAQKKADGSYVRISNTIEVPFVIP